MRGEILADEGCKLGFNQSATWGVEIQMISNKLSNRTSRSLKRSFKQTQSHQNDERHSEVECSSTRSFLVLIIVVIVFFLLVVFLEVAAECWFGDSLDVIARFRRREHRCLGGLCAAAGGGALGGCWHDRIVVQPVCRAVLDFELIFEILFESLHGLKANQTRSTIEHSFSNTHR